MTRLEPTSKRLRVSVKNGMFSSERSVSFSAGTASYSLLVDEQDLTANNLLRVVLVGIDGSDAVVELPRETFTSGTRIRIPRSLVLDDDSLRSRHP
jgi:hypothetical protein